MTLVVNDRVQEVSTSTGSGPFVLGGGVTGYQTFSVGIGNTNSTYYTITNGTNWMDILGTYTSAANSITVDKILTSSAGGTTAVSFAAGTKNIFCTYPAATAVLAAPAAYPTIQPSLNLDFANTRQLDPRITFVRNSTAAYYDGQTTAMAEQNLLIGSQTIGGPGWILGSNIVTLNSTTAPDNTTTASSITENATVNSHYIGSAGITVTTGLPYTFSVYLKKGVGATAPQYMQFYAFSAAFNCGINVDLNAGTVYSTISTGSAVTSSSSVSIGNGWYRFIFTATAGSNTTSGNIPAVVFINNNPALGVAPSYLGLVTSDVQVWGAQLEQRSSVTAYTKTTTAAITNYIPQLMTAPAGVARFDCNPITGKSLGLLIEESRTNLFTYSGDLSLMAQSNTTTTPNICIAPDGTLTGSLLIPNTVSAQHFSTKNISTSGTNTFFVYAKAGGYNWLGMSGTGNGFTTFNLATGIVGTVGGGVTASIISAGNGWYKCSVTQAWVSQTNYIFIEPGDGQYTWTPNGYSGIYIWGAQLEAGSFATSYTATLASTVTRAADSASMTGTNFSSWYNQSQGTMYAEGDFAAGLSSENFYALMGGDYQVFGVTQRRSNLTTRVYDVYTNYNAYLGGQAFTVGANQESFKEAVAISNSYFQSSINGVTATPTYSLITTGNATKLLIGQYFFSLTMTGHIRKLSYYPVALSSNNLVALTS
jgi:hypothetical protein